MATTKTAPTYGAGPVLSAIPSRATSGADLSIANALLEIISTSVDGDDGETFQTASDGAVHADSATARSEANKAKRLVRRVLPNGATVESRVYAADGGFRWAIWLGKAKSAPVTSK